MQIFRHYVEQEQARGGAAAGEGASEWCMIVSTADFRTVPSTVCSVLCIRLAVAVRERDNKQKRGAWGKVGQSRQHACWNSACAMGITRFQINFGES